MSPLLPVVPVVVWLSSFAESVNDVLDRGPTADLSIALAAICYYCCYCCCCWWWWWWWCWCWCWCCSRVVWQTRERRRRSFSLWNVLLRHVTQSAGGGAVAMRTLCDWWYDVRRRCKPQWQWPVCLFACLPPSLSFSLPLTSLLPSLFSSRQHHWSDGSILEL